MSRPVVLLFAGQGAQKVGMGRDLAEASGGVRDLLARADEALGFGLTDVMFEGSIDELTRTSRCQPALFVHGLACLQLLRDRVPDLGPVAAAGLSLGEFTAHQAAGTFGFEAGLRIVHRRGVLMEEACGETDGTMAAMIGGTEEGVGALADSCGIDVANFNAPGQIVVSGSRDGVTKAVAGARGAGCRMGKELNVAGAYHSRLMASAQEKLAAELRALEISAPAFPVVANFTAAPVSDPGEIRSSLENQVTGSVRWSSSMVHLLDQGHETFVELGPGGVLAGLMGRIRKGTNVIPAGDLDAIEKAAGLLR